MSEEKSRHFCSKWKQRR